MRRERIHVWKSAQESAFVFLLDERIRLLLLLDSIQHMGYNYLLHETRALVTARLKELEKN